WLPPSLAYDSGTTAVENWTLEGRFESQRMWGWQQRWVRSRARGVLEGSLSPRQLRAALPLADLSARSSLQSKAMIVVARGLIAPDPGSRSAAALCLYSLTGMDADARPPLVREIEAMLPDLQAVVADPSQPADVTIAAAYAISRAGPAAERAVP